MAKVALYMDDLPDTEVIQLANRLHDGVVEHAADFTGITPTVVALQAVIDDAQAKLTAQQMADEAAKSATTAKNAAIATLKLNLRNFGASAELVTGGDAVKLQNGAFTLVGARQPIGELAKVTNLAVTYGDNPAELDLTFEPVTGKKSYEVWVNLTPNNPAGWQFKVSLGKSSGTLNGLPSGTTIQLKVRAVGGSSGYGPFSDIAEHLVP